MSDAPVRVIELSAENVKMLKAVRFRPDPNLQVIAGSNGAGKTSVLDAVWSALAGGRGPDMPDPIRHGEDHAEVTLDLGELLVTRTWDRGRTSKLSVTSANGALLKSPQGVLDRLLGDLSFDPLAFAQQKGREQRDTLLGLVELPFDLGELDGRRAAVFAERTAVGRELRTAAARLAGLPAAPKGEPVLSVSDAVDELSRLQAVVAENERLRAGVREVASRASTAEAKVDAAQREYKRAEAAFNEAMDALDAAKAEHAAAMSLVAVNRDAVGELVDPDLTAARERVAAAEASTAQRAAAGERERVAAEHDEIDARHTALTAQLEQLDETKVVGLREARMPIAGLSITDDGVTYNEVPFSQCSGAEQLRVSLAIAMAANPRLRVIRIADGSLLDANGMRLIAEMAEEHDFQVFIERVGDADHMGVVIVDGEVDVDYSEAKS